VRLIAARYLRTRQYVQRGQCHDPDRQHRLGHRQSSHSETVQHDHVRAGASITVRRAALRHPGKQQKQSGSGSGIPVMAVDNHGRVRVDVGTVNEDTAVARQPGPHWQTDVQIWQCETHDNERKRRASQLIGQLLRREPGDPRLMRIINLLHTGYRGSIDSVWPFTRSRAPKRRKARGLSRCSSLLQQRPESQMTPCH